MVEDKKNKSLTRGWRRELQAEPPWHALSGVSMRGELFYAQARCDWLEVLACAKQPTPEGPLWAPPEETPHASWTKFQSVEPSEGEGGWFVPFGIAAALTLHTARRGRTAKKLDNTPDSETNERLKHGGEREAKLTALTRPMLERSGIETLRRGVRAVALSGFRWHEHHCVANFGHSSNAFSTCSIVMSLKIAALPTPMTIGIF